MPFLVVLGALIGAANLGHSFQTIAEATLLDVGVFRDAGQALVSGDPLYEGFPSRSGYAFIYPPFAALLFVPLTWLPEVAMDVAWNTAIIAAIFAIMATASHRLNLRPWWAWAIGLTGFATLLDTVYTNLYYGQINVFLILLVALDVFGFTPKYLRGIGIGVAAGIKITPAAYAVIFLVRKDWRGVLQSAGYFLLTAIIGFILRPKESVYFWTEEFFATDRGGGITYPPNQGIGGMLSRGIVPAHIMEALSPVILLLFAAASIFVAYRLEQSGRKVESLLVVVLGIALGGPFAVSHHWVGIVLILPLIVAVREQWMRIVLAVAAGAMITPGYKLVPEDSPDIFDWPLWLTSNVIGLMGLTVFIAYVVLVSQQPPQQDRSSDSDSSADPGAGQRSASPATAEVDPVEPRAGELHRQSHTEENNS